MRRRTRLPRIMRRRNMVVLMMRGRRWNEVPRTLALTMRDCLPPRWRCETATTAPPAAHRRRTLRWREAAEGAEGAAAGIVAVSINGYVFRGDRTVGAEGADANCVGRCCTGVALVSSNLLEIFGRATCKHRARMC